MTVSAQTLAFKYTANGVTTTFPYQCRILFVEQLKVYVDGVIQVGGYTVFNVGNQNGGDVVFSVAPVNGATVLIRRISDRVRTTDFQQAPYFTQEELLDLDQDYQTMLLQEAAAEGDKSIRIPSEETVNTILPSAAERAGKQITFGANGEVILTDTAAAIAGADLVFAATKAAADSLAAGLGDGATVIVDRDETRNHKRTRYTVASAALTSPIDDTSFVQAGTGAVPRAIQDKEREVVSVTDYMTDAEIADAASGSPVLNHTTKIQAAINAMEARGGGSVLIPPSHTFRTTASLKNKTNVTIYGMGESSIIFGDGAFKIFDQDGLDAWSNIAWSNFKIKGSATAYDAAKESAHGINLLHLPSKSAKISDMWFENVWGDGIYVRCNDVDIHNIHCKNTYRQGIAVTKGTHISINHIRGEGTMITLVDIEPNTGDTIEHLNINDVEFYNPAIPALRFYMVTPTYDSIKHVTISNIVSYGLSLGGTNGLTASNLTCLNTDSVESLGIGYLKNANITNITMSGTASTIKGKINAAVCENVTISNVVIYGGSPIDINLLDMTNCTLSNFILNNSGGTGCRLRNSVGTLLENGTINGAANYGYLLLPTTSLDKTTIKGARFSSVGTGIYLGGTVNNIYIDANYTGCTTALTQAVDFSGTIRNLVWERAGNYTATMTPTTSGTITLSGSFDQAAYVVHGSLCTVQGFLLVESVSSPVGAIDISLPFAPASLTDASEYSAAALAVNGSVSANVSDFVARTEGSNQFFRVYLGDGLTLQTDSAEQMKANTVITFSITYRVA